jgi:hypothetical protein
MLHKTIRSTAAVVAAASLTGGLIVGARQAPPQVEFRAHVIEPKFPGGYAVHAVDLNRDSRIDVIGVTQRAQELTWYENPTWDRHVIVGGMDAMVNLAASDLDGDGVPEIALQSSFAMVPAKSEGLVWLLRHQGNPRQPWKEQRLDQVTTSHHVVWADVDGDGTKELVNAPLIGPAGAGPTYDQDKVPLLWYRQTDWRRRIIADDINGILHRVRPVFWDGDRREELLAASFDGIVLYRATGSGDTVTWAAERLSPGHAPDKAPRLGASDVAVGRLDGARFLASVEPWHGNEIVVYLEGRGGWTRTVLFDGMTTGHEVAVADFNGDGRDDIVAGDRSGDTASVHVMYAPNRSGAPWQHQVLDPGGMAASGCVAADINRDRRIDLVCAGGATANIKWYENLSGDKLPATPNGARLGLAKPPGCNADC